MVNQAYNVQEEIRFRNEGVADAREVAKIYFWYWYALSAGDPC